MLNKYRPTTVEDAASKIANLSLFEAFCAKNGFGPIEPFSVNGAEVRISKGDIGGRICIRHEEFWINLNYKGVDCFNFPLEHNGQQHWSSSINGSALDQAFYDQIQALFDDGILTVQGAACEGMTFAKAEHEQPQFFERIIYSAYELAGGSWVRPPDEFIDAARQSPDIMIKDLMLHAMPTVITSVCADDARGRLTMRGSGFPHDPTAAQKAAAQANSTAPRIVTNAITWLDLSKAADECASKMVAEHDCYPELVSIDGPNAIVHWGT